MITINLLPKNLKRVERKKVVFPYKALLMAIVAGLVLVHLLLLSVAALKKIQIASLKSNWSKMAPETKDSASVHKEINSLENKVKTIKEVVSRKASLTELLSSLNAAVPKGLWLDRFTFADQGLVIQGSVVSLTQNEMTIIGKFLQDLRGAKTVSSVFPKIELSSVQRRTIRTFDVVDFVLTGEMKK